MTKAAQVTCLGQDGKRVDWPDARDLLQAAEVGVLAQQLAREPLNDVALRDQVPCLGDDEPEHGDRRRLGRDRQGNGRPGGVVDVAEQARLATLRPARSQAAATKASLLRAVMLLG